MACIEEAGGVAFQVKVDEKRCRGCEECLEACTVSVLEMKDGKCHPANGKECIGCKACVEICEENAITVEDLEPEMSEIARLLLKDIL